MPAERQRCRLSLPPAQPPSASDAVRPLALRFVLGAQSDRFAACDPLGRLGVAQSFRRGTTRGGVALFRAAGVWVCSVPSGGSTAAPSSEAAGGGIESTNSIAGELSEVDRIQKTANTTAPPPAIHRSQRCVQRGRRHKAHPVHPLLSSNVIMIPQSHLERRPGGAVDHTIYRKTRLIAIIPRPVERSSARRF
jgi:hypothetical protein